MYSSIGKSSVDQLISKWLYCVALCHAWEYFIFLLRGVFWVRLIFTLMLYSPNMSDVIVLDVCELPSGGL